MSFLGLVKASKLAEKENELKVLSEKYNQLNGQKTGLEVQVSTLSKEIQEQNIDIKKKGDELLESGKTIASLNKKIAEAKLALDAFKETKQTLKENDETMASQAKRIDGLVEELKNLKKLNATYFGKMGSQAAQISRLKSKLEAYEGLNKSIDEHIEQNQSIPSVEEEPSANDEPEEAPIENPDEEPNAELDSPKEKGEDQVLDEDFRDECAPNCGGCSGCDYPYENECKSSEASTSAKVITNTSSQFEKDVPKELTLVVDKKFSVGAIIFTIKENGVAIFLVSKVKKSTKGKWTLKVIYDEEASTTALCPSMFEKGVEYFQ